MLNRKLLQQALSLACVALTWATTVSAGNSPAAADDGTLQILVVAGAILLLVSALVWRSLASRAKKPDPAAFMTLGQITQLEMRGSDSTLMRTVQPKAISSLTAATPRDEKPSTSTSDTHLSELEKHYPRIVEKLVMLWNDPEAENYLHGLSFDERGDREGFNREVAAEIILLYGVKLKEHKDIWH